MRQSAWLFALALFQNSACIVDNPRNCDVNTNACGQNERCNPDTQRCETLDCTVNLGLCSDSQFCDGTTKRCAAKDCTLDPTLCTATQDCDGATKQCLTRAFVLGQPDALSNLNAAYGLSFPLSVLLVPDVTTPGSSKLIVGDNSNQRVLIWNAVPTTNRPADAVLGAPDVNTLPGGSPYGGISERSFNQPWSVTSDGMRLVVGDQVLQRLLIFNQIPAQPSGNEPIPANQLWGQTDFESSSPNGGGDQVNATGVNIPSVFLDQQQGGGGAFYVADRLNNRVLTFSGGVPGVPANSPSIVLGQMDMVSNTAGTTATTLREPRGMASDGMSLYVCDVANHRVLVYNLPITTNGVGAVNVIGQSTFTTGTPNLLGLSATSLSSPTGISIPVMAGAKPIFVVDFGNNRVLRYPGGSAQADLVLGQPSFVLNARNRGGPATGGTMAQPHSVSSDGLRLAVADAANNRVLIWQTMPTQNGQVADVVLGQPDATSTSPNNPPTRSALQFRDPIGVDTDGTHLAVVDSTNNRVLLWNNMPHNGATAPDIVIGQIDFMSNLANNGTAASASTLSNPQFVSFDSGRMLVADSGNNRVLIWNQIPTANAAPADFVIGQPDFVTVTAKASPRGLNQASGAVMSQGVLYVADQNSNRVLIYHDPLQMNPPADLVLGQPNFGAVGANLGGQSASSLNSPHAVLVADGQLIVADRNNHRVLIWNSIPTMNQQAANVVVGQTDFISSYTHTDRSRLAFPRNLLVNNGRLYVSTNSQNRILYWNQIPTTNGLRADGVLGQSDYTSVEPNSPDLQPLEKLSAPAAMSAFADQLFIADTLNHRLVIRVAPSP